MAGIRSNGARGRTGRARSRRRFLAGLGLAGSAAAGLGLARLGLPGRPGAAQAQGPGTLPPRAIVVGLANDEAHAGPPPAATPTPAATPSPTATPAPSATVTPSPAAEGFRMTGEAVAALAPFDQAMQEYMTARKIPNGALAVTDQGRLVLARAYTNSGAGEAIAPDALFRLASNSKTITAATIMRLVQAGKLTLDSRLSEFVPPAPPFGQTADSRLADITIRHLLQHLGGWDRDATFDPLFRDAAISTALGVSLPISIANIVTYMSGQPLQAAPGSKYSYSNHGYLLLGRVIEKVTGKPYGEAVQEEVLSPLGISRMALGRSLLTQRAAGEVTYSSTRTGRSVVDTSGATVPSAYGGFSMENAEAAGGWIASAIDVARFLRILDPSNTVLTGESKAATTARPVTNPASPTYYGLGWQVRDRGQGASFNLWHYGSLPGTRTFAVHYASGRSWAALFNQRDESDDELQDNAIDPLLNTAAGKVTSWPTGDLFPSFA